LTRRVNFLFLFPPHPETTPATIHARACSAGQWTLKFHSDAAGAESR
jgi:hypothetical protein